jgi:hypothetical protein
MQNSPNPRHKHFIAINSHGGHSAREGFVCCASVMHSVAPLVRQKGPTVRIVLFHHSDSPFDEQLRIDLTEMGVEISEHPASANGTGLNLQLQMALDAGFDFFYRVDADDTVDNCRFPRQSDILIKKDVDLCGGGLMYKEKKSDTSFLVLPRQNPNHRDFLSNQYMLHPTIALRLETIKTHNIRYWAQRLEDKRLALDLNAHGLTVFNDQVVYGIYNLNRNARNRKSFALLNLKLNLRFLQQNGNVLGYPRALLMYALHLIFPNHVLRVLRNRLARLRRVKPLGEAQ